MANIILIIILIVIAGGAMFYIYKAKKSGQHCIGCPHGKKCNKLHCNCGKDDKLI
ncbi:MAG: FeoB-associated Cys-rich membrane protein [Ruminococcaceae bacterium]|nr:FeoB-associated Cys-rich membrane protein [Oscillospiraceae bacterium]